VIAKLPNIMGALADRLDDMTIEAVSPDGKIHARVRRQGDSIDVTFQRGAYQQYREQVLAHQCGRLAMLVFARYRRDEREIVESALPTEAGDSEIDASSERRRYLEALEHVTAVGATDDQQISITSRRLISWEITIADGALDRRTEEQFRSELVTTLHRLLADYRTQVFRLKDEIYDLGYPASLRAAIGLAPRG
jgi:hypothetical protein